MPQFMQDADRIVGGEAAPSMIPWQVAMLSGSFQFCGGTVLDSCTILTAAHCGINTGHSIRAGSLDKTDGGQERSISQVISNTDLPYNSQTTNNDWVIAKLSSPLEMNGNVQAACLPSSASYLPTTSTEARCFTSGWGTLSSGGSSPNNLHYVRVPAITNSACNSQYGGSITDSMLCAGYPNVGGKDACQGDSGGPYVCNDNGNAVIAGVVSWGIGCAHPNYAGVYSRVTKVLSWIQSNMGSCGGSPSPPPSPSPPSPPPPTPSPPSSGCGSPQWQGDNYCDDENNNGGCDFDGGDCCGANVNTQYCSLCACLE
jgi:trypsin